MSAGDCPECGGVTIKYRGKGKDLQQWVCPRYKEPGHLSQEEMMRIRREVVLAHCPTSGRFG